MKQLIIIFCIALFLLTTQLFQGCNSTEQNATGTKDTLEGQISICGAFALYPMAVMWKDEFVKIHPNVRIDISAGGAGKGITDALSGMVDMGMVSRSISPEEISKGAWYIAVTRDAVLPTINSQNPLAKELMVRGLTQQQFTDIFITGKIKDWGFVYGNKPVAAIDLFTRSDACGAAEMWAKYMGKKQEDLKGVGVYGDPGMAEAIRKDENSIGFNNVIYAYDLKSGHLYDGLAVIPIDLNGNGMIDSTESFYSSLTEISKAIKGGNYPSPPARDLYFVSNGKPKSIVVTAFLKWILSDGQKFVTQGGYVELSPEKIETERKKL